MNQPLTRQITYSELRRRPLNRALASVEVPEEHFISDAMPTLRWGEPAFAIFSAPALRLRDQPVRLGAPDRWWLISPSDGHLIVYALTRFMPFAGDIKWDELVLPPSTQTIAELREQQANADLLLDRLAPAFFANESADISARRALFDVLNTYIPEPLRPRYMALAPDFFKWLQVAIPSTD